MPPQASYISIIDDLAHHDADPCLVDKQPLVKFPLLSQAGQPRKSVSFNEMVRAKKTLHLKNFSDQELDNYWYKPEDFAKMKGDVRFEAKLLENECLDGNDCLNGLGVFTTSGAKRRSQNKRRAVAVVLEEQELQVEEGSNDPEYIADIYARTTTAARREAIESAAR